MGDLKVVSDKSFSLFGFKVWNVESRGASLENPSTTLKEFFEQYGSLGSSAGISVVPEGNALNLSAVWAAINILSSSLASLPIYHYKRIGKDKEILWGSDIQLLIHDTPNKIMTPYTFYATLEASRNLYGNAYAYIDKDNFNIPIAMIWVHPDKVKVKKVKDELFYDIEDFKDNIPARDMIHVPGLSFNGITGKSPIQVAKESIGGGLATQEFGNTFFAHGAKSSGVLTHPGSLGKLGKENVSKSYEKGVKDAHKIMVLEEGMKYQQLTIPPEQAQWLQSRKFTIVEMARWFSLPPHMLGELSDATFSNVEHMGMQFVIYNVRSRAKMYEQEFNKKLVYNKNEFTKFDLNALMRGDSAGRSSYYSTLFNIGVLSQNDIRILENMNKIDGGDKYYVPLALTDGKNVNKE